METGFANAALAILVGLGLVCDVRTNRIPNWLTFSGIGCGLLLGIVSGGWPGLVISLKGLFLGLFILFIPFLLGGLGGGDVKLMAAVGALKGSSFVLSAVLLTFLWGGVIGLAALIVSKRFSRLNGFLGGLKLFAYTHGRIGQDVLIPSQEERAKDRLVVPYAIPIFLGVVTTCFYRLPIPG